MVSWFLGLGLLESWNLGILVSWFTVVESRLPPHKSKSPRVQESKSPSADDGGDSEANRSDGPGALGLGAPPAGRSSKIYTPPEVASPSSYTRQGL